MRTRLLTALVLASTLLGTAARAEPGVTIEHTQSRIVADEAGRGYAISLLVPPGEPPAEGWPVIYALDGGWTFATFTDALRVQGGRPEVTGVRPAVVVGIGYPAGEGGDNPRRQTDLTPPQADRFLDFLEHRLIPAIEGEFPVDRGRRTLFGHSLGGLFTLHVLLTRPEAFRSYVAASPSLWWKDQAMLIEAPAALRRARPPVLPSVLITVGEQEQVLPGASPEMAARLARRRQVDNAAEMTGMLSAAGLPAELVVFAGENHGSTIPAAVSRAVRFALSERKGG